MCVDDKLETKIKLLTSRAVLKLGPGIFFDYLLMCKCFGSVFFCLSAFFTKHQGTAQCQFY